MRSAWRTDPVPLWTVSAWREDDDQPYREIRREAEEILKTTPGLDKDQLWVRRAASAYHDWHDDYRNPEKLFKAALYVYIARKHGQNLQTVKDFEKARSQINLGWSLIRKIPNSYEYSRLGYIYNAGDFDYHKYGDLGQRLIARDPTDRDVAVALVDDYSNRKPEPEFEKFLFAALETCSKSKRWKAWDFQRMGQAYRIYGQRHKDRAAYRKAIELAEIAKQKTGPGWDASWIDGYILTAKAEMKDPNFGVMKGSRPIWEMDP